MTGILIVNEFVKSDKFSELFDMFEAAANRCGVELIRITNAKAWGMIGENSYHGLYTGASKDSRPDFILFWDKDIKLAFELEREGFRLFNKAQAIADCDDKSLTYLKLSHAGIRQPETFISPKKFHADGMISDDFLDPAIRTCGFPCIIKECLGSFGAQVYLADSEEALRSKITDIGERSYIIQKYIRTSKGRDVRIQVAGNEVVAAMYRYNDNDFRANITNGGSMKPFDPSPEMAQMAVSACRALDLDFAGVDILFGEDDSPVLCEVNSNAHFKNLYDCTGINTADAIMRHIINSL
ncbi:MAG: RimK family alpha-L-glutamate ligase [Lachnospiraceae bacterium]|nr:RimK family alpha-L-glutamate ligase [Lachnospiraceae bacterium]